MIVDYIYSLGFSIWKAFAACGNFASIKDGADCVANNTELSKNGELSSVFSKVTNILLVIIGIASVIVIIIAGLRMVVSQGDPKSFESARNTILYAIVGIVIALLAYAIISFVLNSITGTT